MYEKLLEAMEKDRQRKKEELALAVKKMEECLLSADAFSKRDLPLHATSESLKAIAIGIQSLLTSVGDVLK